MVFPPIGRPAEGGPPSSPFPKEETYPNLRPCCGGKRKRGSSLPATHLFPNRKWAGEGSAPPSATHLAAVVTIIEAVWESFRGLQFFLETSWLSQAHTRD